LNETLKEAGKNINKKITPHFEEEVGQLSKPKIEKMYGGDALTKVGNFLGTSRAAINSIQQQMLVHTMTISRNSTAMLGVLQPFQ